MVTQPKKMISCRFWMRLFTLSAGYSEPLSAGCKQYTVGFTALDDSSSTATAEIAVNGMDPPELGFSPAESTTGTSGQSRHITCGRLHRLQLRIYSPLLSKWYSLDERVESLKGVKTCCHLVLQAAWLGYLTLLSPWWCYHKGYFVRLWSHQLQPL